jgi:hypothetical protein
MKFKSQLFTACLLVLVSGGSGYFLGKRQTTPALAAGGTRGNEATRPSFPPRAGDIDRLDLQALHAELSAEKNPLLRFKLALRNLEAWVATNPQDALAWLGQEPASDRRDEVLRMALQQFAENDPRGVADWALKNLKGAELNNALIGIASDWAGQSGREAADWFLTQAATPERDAAVETLLFAWGANEPIEALDFINNAPKLEALSPTLRRAALAGWAKSDPAAAVAQSLALSRTHSDPSQFANTLANWATMDLAASSAWLLSDVPAGPERVAAAGELGTIFAQQSPETGVTWLAKLNAGSERDAAANSLASEWARTAPADAAKWASSQTASLLEAETIETIGRNFLIKDAPAFEAWRAGLPDGPLKNQLAEVGLVTP